jgi:hypothetical protein
VVNTYYPGTGTASAGSNTVGIGSIRLGGGNAIAAGDLVLIIQMQDGSGGAAGFDIWLHPIQSKG